MAEASSSSNMYSIEVELPDGTDLITEEIEMTIAEDGESRVNERMVSPVLSPSKSVDSPTIGSDTEASIFSKRKRDYVWLYFEEITNKETKQVNSRCLLCKKMCAGNNTCNLKHHLIHKHKEQYDEIEGKKVKKKGILQIKNKESKEKQLTIEECLKKGKYNKNHPKQLQFNFYVSVLIGANPLPFTLIENTDFINLILCLDKQINILGIRKLHKNIDIIEAQVKNKIIELLKNTDRLTVCTDGWSKNGLTSSYLGMNCTFYDKVNKKKQICVLGIKKFPLGQSHTGGLIRQMSLELLKDYEIPVDKVWRICTDNGSNFVLAFQEELEDLFEASLMVETDESCQIGRNASAVIQSVEDGVYTVLPYRRMPCFIHTMLLVLNNLKEIKEINELIDLIKITVSTISTSISKTENLIRFCGKTVVKLSPTRWNSLYLVIKRLQEINRIDDKAFAWTRKQWYIANDLCEFLEPFHEATNMSNSEANTSISSIFYTIRKIEQHLNKFNENHEPFMKDLALKFLADFQNRFQYITNHNDPKFDPIFITATYLHPTFKHLLNSKQEQIAKDMIEISVNKESVNENTLNLESNIQEFELNILNTVIQSKFKSKKKNVPDIDLELSSYEHEMVLDEKLNIFEFWIQRQKSYPLMSGFASEVMAMPTSTGSVERIFSACGIATLGRRNRLEGDHLEREVFLWKNHHLIDYELIRANECMICLNQFH